MSDTSSSDTTFRDLKLPASLLATLDEVGYETPTPIQAQAIPHLLEGLDLLGHAPTGSGKTAAFALPLLARLEIDRLQVQIMVLTPTRELAIQVAEAFQRYASRIKGFHVLPIYGGQEYSGQIRQLKRGVHAVVGTPGRVMDHMRKGTLKLDGLQALVLDEGDEMLNMGFIDDVDWILEQTPEHRQMALFSATMPKEIQRIARRHLRDPQQIAIKTKTATADTIRQRYWPVDRTHKLDALTRILEVEPFDALLMFVRTKTATTMLAERLKARGYAAAALNGDMAQKDRERTVERLKMGTLDILVATDVAARGLDVGRISHVVNYDIPHDAESYIHRIGRTGRAGRSGQAYTLALPEESRALAAVTQLLGMKIPEVAAGSEVAWTQADVPERSGRRRRARRKPEDRSRSKSAPENAMATKAVASDIEPAIAAMEAIEVQAPVPPRKVDQCATEPAAKRAPKKRLAKKPAVATQSFGEHTPAFMLRPVNLA